MSIKTVSTRRCAATVLAAVAVAALAVPAAAGASAKATPASAPVAHAAVGAHQQAVRNSPAGSSSSGAGYFIPLAGVTSISAEFTIPAVSCVNSEDYEWLVPGIWLSTGGFYDQWVSAFNDCAQGAQIRHEDTCLNGFGCDFSWDVQPGDKIRVSLLFSPSSTTGTVTDITQDLSVQFVGDPTTGDDTALIGDVSNGQFVTPQAAAVPTFTAVVFTQVKINGAPLSALSSSRASLQTGSDVQISTGNIRHDGKSFITTFRHND